MRTTRLVGGDVATAHSRVDGATKTGGNSEGEIENRGGTMSGEHDLQPAALDWIGPAVGGTVRRVDRAVARREAWLVDVERPDGSVVELFLRLALSGDPANSSAALDKETRIVQALADSPIPVPRIHGILEDPHVVLFERVPGRSDLHNTPPEQQDVVYRHYMEILGELHQLDAEQLALPPMDRPVDALDCRDVGGAQAERRDGGARPAAVREVRRGVAPSARAGARRAHRAVAR